jgi:hypothetical protein
VNGALSFVIHSFAVASGRRFYASASGEPADGGSAVGGTSNKLGLTMSGADRRFLESAIRVTFAVQINVDYEV